MCMKTSIARAAVGVFLGLILALMAQGQEAPSPGSAAPSSLSAAKQSPSLSASGARFQITGTLVDQITNQPLARARVAVAPVTDRSSFSTMMTGDDGRFAFRRLAAGKYTLTAQRRGYLTRSFNQHDQFSSSIVLGPGLDAGDLLFRLPPEAIISGLITDEQGEPVREAQVLVFRQGDTSGREGIHIVGRTISDDEGSYRVAHLAPGKYMVAVSASPWYAQRPNSGGAVLNGGTGFISAGDGGPGSNGHLSAPEVDEKTAALDVAYPITFYPGAVDSAAASLITLAFGDKAEANINLQPVRALHFRVKAEGTEGRTYTTLEARVFDDSVSIAGNSQRVQDGMLEVSGVAPGRYTLKINDFSNGPPQTVTTYDLEASGDGEVQRPGVARVPLTVVFQYEAGASAQPQGAVSLYNKKTTEAFTERINAKGEAEFKGGVLPGTYEVSISNAGGAYLKTIVSPGLRPLGRTVEIRGPGAQKMSLVVSSGEARISGVALKDDKPLAGVMVVLVPSDPGHNFVLFRRDQSDSDGTFTLANVVPGKYTVLALENGWDLAWNKPDVLKPLLPQGEALNVLPNGKYEVKLKVQ